MTDTIHLSAADAADRLRDKIDAFIFSISFEERSPVILNQLGSTGIKVVAFHNANHDYHSKRVAELKATVENVTFGKLDSDSPLRSFDVIRDVILGLSEAGPVKCVAVDITCFTREALSMLIVVLKHVLPHGTSITLLYTKAADYPVATERSAVVPWFSRGIAEVRSILGYRGNIQLLAGTHLILLPGFEVERAQAIVDSLEPDRLTIGRITPGESIQPNFAKRAQQMAERIEACYSNQFISYCDFSARDPYLTRDKVAGCVVTSENTVVACMNTKIAMVGACLAALQHPTVQLIYAQPLNYNIGIETEASDQVILFDI